VVSDTQLLAYENMPVHANRRRQQLGHLLEYWHLQSTVTNLHDAGNDATYQLVVAVFVAQTKHT
jgi:hypothetical protein